MIRSYVKDLYEEHWDDYQLASVSARFGGNRRFDELLKEFRINELPIDEKYEHPAVKYYARKHLALLDGKQFTELPPVKNWNERLERV